MAYKKYPRGQCQICQDRDMPLYTLRSGIKVCTKVENSCADSYFELIRKGRPRKKAAGRPSNQLEAEFGIVT